jgi:hypothetical protein
LVQTLPHFVVPPVQTSEQVFTPATFTQDCPALQAFEQEPQWSISFRSLHVPPQLTCVPGHETEQLLALQT